MTSKALESAMKQPGPNTIDPERRAATSRDLERGAKAPGPNVIRAPSQSERHAAEFDRRVDEGGSRVDPAEARRRASLEIVARREQASEVEFFRAATLTAFASLLEDVSSVNLKPHELARSAVTLARSLAHAVDHELDTMRLAAGRDPTAGLDWSPGEFQRAAGSAPSAVGGSGAVDPGAPRGGGGAGSLAVGPGGPGGGAGTGAGKAG